MTNRDGDADTARVPISIADLFTLDAASLAAPMAAGATVTLGERTVALPRDVGDARRRLADEALDLWLDHPRDAGRLLDGEAALRGALRTEARFLERLTSALGDRLRNGLAPSADGADALRTILGDSRVPRRLRFKALDALLLVQDAAEREATLTPFLALDREAARSRFRRDDREAMLDHLGWLGVADAATWIERLAPSLDIEDVHGAVWALLELQEAPEPLVGPRFAARLGEGPWAALEARALGFLEDDDRRVAAIGVLRHIGTPRSLGPLRPWSRGFFRARALKDAARAALDAIEARGVGPGAGALSIAAGPAGALSLPRRDDLRA